MYASKGAAVIIGHGTMNCFKIGKGTSQSYILLPCLFNFCAENTMKKKKISMKLKLETKFMWEILITLIIPMTNTEMTEEI